MVVRGVVVWVGRVVDGPKVFVVVGALGHGGNGFLPQNRQFMPWPPALQPCPPSTEQLGSSKTSNSPMAMQDWDPLQAKSNKQSESVILIIVFLLFLYDYFEVDTFIYLYMVCCGI